MAVSVLIVAAASTALGARLTQRGSKPEGGPASAAPVKPSIFGTEADASDAFDDWSAVGSDPDVRFLATITAHTGDFGLLVERPATDTQGQSLYLTQPVTATSDAPMHLSLWAKSDGSAAGAVAVQISSTTTAVLTLPGGTYDWTQFTLEYAVPSGQHRVNIRILSEAPTTGMRLDDLQIQGYGSTGVVLQNPGFEDNSADLHLANDSLLFDQGTVTLDAVTRSVAAGDVRWDLKNDEGTVHRSGTAAIAKSQATIAITSVPPGYYTVRLRAGIDGRKVDRSTNLAVFSQLPAAALTGSAFGVGVHLGGESAQELAQKMEDLAALGIRYVRIDATWSQIELSRGQYTYPADLVAEVAAMQHEGIRPLLIPDYANPLYDGGKTPSTAAGIAAYAKFSAALAARFPNVDIDVYNEFDFRFNTGACGQTPACYLQLLTPTAAAVRAAAPGTTIAAPSITGIGVNLDWLKGFVGGGGLASTDAIAIHPYVQPAPPESLGGDLDSLNSMTASAHGGTAVPIWFTEYGYSTVPGWVSEAQQAAYLTRTTGVALAHGVARLYWYDATNDSPIALDLESNFGLFRLPTSLAPRARVPKPAAAAEGTAARQLAGLPFAGGGVGGDSSLYSYTFGSGAATTRMVWSTGDPVSVQYTGSDLQFTTTTGSAAVVKRTGSRSTITVGAAPVFVRGSVTTIDASAP